MPGVVPLRPLGLGELLDGAMKIMRRYPKPTLGLSAAIAVVQTLLNVAILLVFSKTSDFTVSTSSDSSVSSGFNDGLDRGGGAVELLARGLGYLLAFIAGLVLTGALVSVVGKAVLGQPTSLEQVWTTVRPRLWALVGLSLLSTAIWLGPVVVGVGVGVVLGIALGAGGVVLGVLAGLAGGLLGVWLYVQVSLAAPALVLEKTAIRTSLRRSGVLVKPSWWRVFGVLALTAVITAVLSSILSIPLLVVGAVLSVSSGSTFGIVLLTAIGAGLASIIVAPFSSGVRALLYVDQRMRFEGLDVALQTAAATTAVPVL